MSDINIGSISTSLILQLEGLGAGISQATAMISQFGSNMQANMGNAMMGVGGIVTGLGVAIVGSLGAAVKVGGDFEQMMQQTAANTTMTTQDIAVMNDTVRKLGSESAAPLKELAEGFMHASNFGFSAADSAKILDAAMHSAVATGGQVGKTTELLAQVMHQFGMRTTEAAGTMNVLHLAAANGNMTLEQFVASAGKSITTARNYGFSLIDVTSALSALTRNGFNAAAASTQITGMMVKITNPAVMAKKYIAELSHVTGVDLVRDFSVAGAAARGLPGILDDIAAAAQKAGRPVAEVLNKIIPATRGGIGATALTGFARKDFNDIRGDAQKAQSGQTDPTADSYAASQKNLNSQLAQFRNQMTLLGADIQKALMPVLTPLLAWAREAIQWFAKLPEPVKQAGIIFVALAGAAAAVIGPLLLIGGAIVTLLPAIEAAGPVLAAIGAALTGPLGIAIVLITAAIAGLALAWRNDWGGIREYTQQFVSWITPYLHQAWSAIKDQAMQAWSVIKDFIADVWPPIQTIITTVWNAIASVIGTVLGAIKSVIVFNMDDIKAIFGFAWEAIKGILTVVFAVIAGLVVTFTKMMTGDWKGANEAFVKYGEMAGKGVLQIFEGLFSALAHILHAIAMSMIEAGKAIVTGLVQGIQSVGSQVGTAITEVAQGAVISAKEALGIHSPSTVFHELGVNIGQGLANGIKAGTSNVKRSMEEMAAALEETYSHIYEMTHSEADVKKRGVEKQYKERLDASVPKSMAGKERDLSLKQIAAEVEEKESAKRKAAAEAEIAIQTHVWDVKRSDADAIKALGDSLAADRKRQNEAELSAEVWMAEVKASDAKAQQALEDAIYADKVKQNQEELAQQVYMAELQANDQQRQKEMDATLSPAQKQQERLKETLNQMKENVTGILGGAFQDLFDGKSHQLFDRMLQNFIKMLEEMAAKALAMGIINLLTGGAGGFLGGKGGGGFLSVFGFDDATNDKKAQRWGFDFGRHFTGGMSDYNNAHKPLQGGSNSRSAGDTHIHVNMPGMVVREHADIDHITDQLAWKIQTGLSGRFVGNGS